MNDMFSDSQTEPSKPLSLNEYLKQQKQEYILSFYRQTGDTKEVCKLLNISLPTIYRTCPGIVKRITIDKVNKLQYIKLPEFPLPIFPKYKKLTRDDLNINTKVFNRANSLKEGLINDIDWKTEVVIVRFGKKLQPVPFDKFFRNYKKLK